MLRAVPVSHFTALLLCASASVLGCATEPESTESVGAAVAASRLAVVEIDVTLPWGEGEGEIGIRAPQAEFLGDGPSGIATLPSGAVIVGDRLNGRGVAVDSSGARTAFAMAADFEQLAVGEDGAMALFSPVRSRVAMRSESGKELGEVAVPRALGDVVGISVGASRRVEVETAFQERYVAGSPSAELGAEQALRTRREGAIAGDGGRAMQAIVDSDHVAFVVVIAPTRGDRATEERRIPVARDVASMRLLGLDHGRVVAVVERVSQGATGPISVTRELTIVDLDANRVLATEPMIGGGLWVPRQTVTMGAGAIAYMVPLPDGLRVVRRSIDAIVAKGGAR